MDQTFTDDIPEQLLDLQPGLYPILLTVLQGFSRQEIAHYAGVLQDYVDLAINKLLEKFKVNSRGELAALFVDERIARWLEDRSNLQP